MRYLNKKIWKHQFQLKTDDRSSILALIKEYCVQLIGKEYTDWYFFERDNYSVFAFKEHVPALSFKLRWGDYVI